MLTELKQGTPETLVAAIITALIDYQSTCSNVLLSAAIDRWVSGLRQPAIKVDAARLARMLQALCVDPALTAEQRTTFYRFSTELES